jgi:hypothetical protein
LGSKGVKDLGETVETERAESDGLTITSSTRFVSSWRSFSARRIGDKHFSSKLSFAKLFGKESSKASSFSEHEVVSTREAKI